MPNKVVERKITVRGDKDSCGHCKEADEALSDAKSDEYEVKYEYVKDDTVPEMPVIEDCKKYEDGTQTCKKIVGFSEDDFEELL